MTTIARESAKSQHDQHTAELRETVLEARSDGKLPRQTRAETLKQSSNLPPDWCYVLVRQKFPYADEWQNTRVNRDAAISAFKADKTATGFGVLCGTPSGGLLFFDHDGASCDGWIVENSGLPLDHALPETVGFTSGRPGRYQLVYKVPDTYWGEISTRKFKTGVKDEDGKDEQVEFRWDGCQSVVCGQHPLTEGYRWVSGRSPSDIAIAEAPDWMIIKMLPEATTAESKPKQRQPHAVKDIPLTKCLAIRHRDLIANGTGEGSRNDNGFALAVDLLGVEAYLGTIGQRYSEDAEDLFNEYCDRCSPPISATERGSIWKSAQKNGGTPCLSEDKIRNCIDAHYKVKAPAPITSSPNGWAQTEDGSSSLDGGLIEEIDQLIQLNLPGSTLQIELDRLAQTYHYKARIDILYKTRLAELDSKTEAASAKTEIDRLQQIEEYDLKIREIVDNDQYCFAIEANAQSLGMPAVAMLMTNLACLASCIHIDTRLELSDGWYAKAIIWFLAVASSGKGKTPAQRKVIQPIIDIESRLRQTYQEDIASYKSAVAQNKDYKQQLKADCERRIKATKNSAKAKADKIKANHKLKLGEIDSGIKATRRIHSSETAILKARLKQKSLTDDERLEAEKALTDLRTRHQAELASFEADRLEADRIIRRDTTAVTEEQEATIEQIQKTLENAESSDLSQPLPPDTWLMQEFTREAVVSRQSEQCDRSGFIIYRDEFNGFFRGMNQYKNGGDDHEFWLEAKMGGALFSDRKNREDSKAATQSQISLVGSIQPFVLKNMMGDFSDDAGLWARFLFVLCTKGRKERPQRGGKLPDVSRMVGELYRDIKQLEPQSLTLTENAFQLFADYCDLMTDRCEAETREGLKAVYSKAAGESGTLAILLHYLNARLNGKDLPSQISARTMGQAIALSKYLLGQIQLIHQMGAVEANETAAVMSALLSYLKKHPGKPFSPPELIRSVSSLKRGRAKSNEVVPLLAGLAETGYIDWDGVKAIYTGDRGVAA